VKVHFKGGKELEAALKGLDMSTAKKRGVANRALDKAAIPIKDEWQRGVDVRKGVLKRSIDIGNRAQTRATRKFRRGSSVVERYVGVDLREDPVRLSIYAPIEEFGDKNQPANPAGRQAFETQKVEAMNRISKELWTEIEKAARRAKK
jgi:HK97 gp10 family phage protein